MNKDLAFILKNRIASLPFIDVLAGLVQTLETNLVGDSLNKVIKFPMSTDTQGADNCIGREKDLQPDSKKKSITYFEDFGTDIVSSRGGVTQFSSKLRLVCWLNKNLLTGDKYAEISGICIASTIAKLTPPNPLNMGIFTGLILKPTRVPQQGIDLFSRYTYYQKDRQFLLPPFEAFAIDLTCTYRVSSSCLSEINFTNENNC